MVKRMSHPIVVCGLSSILAFGAVGCSSSSTSTTEISTTDENGNTTTTTTTTSTDESGKATTETSTVKTDADGNVIDDADQTEDPTDFNGYTNDYYKIGFEIPEGFEDVTASAPDNDENMQLECEVSNADGNATASIFLVPAVTSHEGITDIDSWAEDFTNAFVKSLEDQNVQDINTEIADFSIGGVPYGTVCLVDGTINGTTIYNDFYFVLDEDGDGFFVQLYAESEDDINTLRDSFRAL